MVCSCLVVLQELSPYYSIHFTTYNHLGEYRNSVTFLCFAAIVYTNPLDNTETYTTYTPTPLSQSRATCTCALTHFTLGKSIPASKIHHHYPYILENISSARQG